MLGFKWAHNGEWWSSMWGIGLVVSRYCGMWYITIYFGRTYFQVYQTEVWKDEEKD